MFIRWLHVNKKQLLNILALFFNETSQLTKALFYLRLLKPHLREQENQVVINLIKENYAQAAKTAKIQRH